MDIRKGNDVNVYFDIDALDIVKAEDVKSIRCFFVKDAYVETGGIPTPPDSCIPSSYVIHDHMPPTYNVHVPHWHISRCVHREFSVLDNCSPGWHGNTIFVNKSFLIVTISGVTYIKTSFDGSMQRNGRYNIILEVLSNNDDDQSESNVKYTFDYGHQFDITDQPDAQSGKIDIYPTREDVVDTVHCVDISKYEHDGKYLPIDQLAVYTSGDLGGIVSPMLYTTEDTSWILFYLEKSQDGTTDRVAAFRRNDGSDEKFMYHTTYVGSDIPQWVKDVFGGQAANVVTFTEGVDYESGGNHNKLRIKNGGNNIGYIGTDDGSKVNIKGDVDVSVKSNGKTVVTGKTGVSVTSDEGPITIRTYGTEEVTESITILSSECINLDASELRVGSEYESPTVEIRENTPGEGADIIKIHDKDDTGLDIDGTLAIKQDGNNVFESDSTKTKIRNVLGGCNITLLNGNDGCVLLFQTDGKFKLLRNNSDDTDIESDIVGIRYVNELPQINTAFANIAHVVGNKVYVPDANCTSWIDLTNIRDNVYVDQNGELNLSNVADVSILSVDGGVDVSAVNAISLSSTGGAVSLTAGDDYSVILTSDTSVNLIVGNTSLMLDETKLQRLAQLLS